MIPEDEQFESLLDSLSLSPPEDSSGWIRHTCVPSAEQNDRGRSVTIPEIHLWYFDGKLGISALARKIDSELNQRNHLSNDRLCEVIAGLFAAMDSDEGISAVTRFNRLLDTITDADLNQYIFFGEPYLAEGVFDVEPFHVGKISAEQIAYQCKRAGSDYYERYQSDFNKHRMCLSRDHKKISLIPFQTLEGFNPIAVAYRLTDEYFHILAGLHHDELLQEFEDYQMITKALGGGWFDVEARSRVFGLRRLSIFLNIGCKKMGWVCPSETVGRNVSYGGAAFAIPTTNAVLRDEFGINCPNVRELPPVFQRFCDFLSVAREHHADSRDSEALLHLVIALDLVFGDRENVTRSVTERVALIAHKGLGMSIEDCRKMMKKIYDARSAYVHAGKDVPEKLWDEAYKTCQAVGFALLRRYGKNAGSHSDDQKWLKQIDYVSAAMESGNSPDLAVFREIGLPENGDFDLLQYNELIGTGRSGTFDLGSFKKSEYSFL